VQNRLRGAQKERDFPMETPLQEFLRILSAFGSAAFCSARTTVSRRVSFAVAGRLPFGPLFPRGTG
jgi:hypothetical protein